MTVREKVLPSALPFLSLTPTLQGCASVNASRSDVLLVSAPSGPFILCVITKQQKDESREPANAGYRLLRKVTALAWARFEPALPFPPSLVGPAWP